MRRLPTLRLSAATALLLAGCAAQTPPAPAIEPPPALAAPMPRPPEGLEADTELLPTPNRDLPAAAALWHLRAGLNVAALQCSAAGGTLEQSYNRALSVHRAALSAAHRAMLDAADDRAAFDREMTRVYNYFAQPPARPAFCAVAERLAAEVAATPPGALDERVPAALAELDAPFVRLHAAQDAYRRQLLAWRAGEAAIPRLAYDPRIFLASDQVTAERSPRR